MASIQRRSELNNEQNFLPEILGVIFQNLNVQDLCRAAAVSKSWNEVATNEQKRRGLESTVLSMANVNVYDSVRVKPIVALLFVAPNNRYKNNETSGLDVLRRYKNHFPNCVMTLTLHDVIMDDEFVSWNEEVPESGIASLLIPEYRDLKVRATFAQKFRDTLDAPNLLNEFLPEDSQSNASFIIFVQLEYNKKPLFDLLKKCMEERKQSFSVWGGAFELPPLFAINHQIDESIEREFNDPDHWISGEQANGIFAMSIAGSCLESWSIVINCIAKKHEFDQKLIDFRNQLQLKGQSIGLACGPDKVFDFSGAELSDVYTNFSEMLQAVRKIINNVPFTGICDASSEMNSYYGFKSITDDPRQELQHKMSFSLMILTFD